MKRTRRIHIYSGDTAWGEREKKIVPDDAARSAAKF